MNEKGEVRKGRAGRPKKQGVCTRENVNGEGGEAMDE